MTVKLQIPAAKRLPDGSEWVNRFEAASASGGPPHTVAQHRVKRYWGCSCRGWRTHRRCRHLAELGLLSLERPIEAEFVDQGPSSPAATPAPNPRPSGVVEKPGVNLVTTWDPAMDPTGWWASEKFDGVRAWWDGSRLISRRGNVYAAPDWFTRVLPRRPLDGELWLGPGTFAQMSGVARGGDDQEWRNVKFKAFDVPGHGGKLEQRFSVLFTEVQLAQCAWLEVVEQTLLRSRSHLESLQRDVEARGGEGLVLRRPGSSYVADRSGNWQRVVRVQTAEAVLVGYTAGTGNREGGVGAFVCRLPDGTKFKIGTGLKIKDVKNPPPIGTTLEFGYKCLTAAGVPREPRFLRVREEI